MNIPHDRPSAFSLVEITLALGVTAFCLLAVMGLLPVSFKTQQASVQQTTANGIIAQISADLRADIRLPPGQASKEGFGLKDHWKAVGTPDTLYFTNDAAHTGSANQASAPADAAFRATITYISPPTDTTSLANITVSWPAPVNPSTGGVPAGSVQTFIAANRQ
ncbi:MAG: hypothetical protein WKF37_24595 [Bryobacteraceae bacterium]